MPRTTARLAFAALMLGAAQAGCVTTLDMATAYDKGRPATTIPYAGVQRARQFPDYEPIGKSILTGVDPAAATSSSAKAGKPKGGSK